MKGTVYKMADLELVEKLRERANVTYDEAKEALDASGDDLLEAVIYLERQGKVPPPSVGSFNSKQGQQSGEGEKQKKYQEKDRVTFSEIFGDLFKKLGEIIKKSCVNMFEVWRAGKLIISIPVILLVILLLGCFWVMIPLLIVGLFMDCKYKFHGTETEATGINKIIEDVANAADELKNEVKNAQNTHKD